ncbi:hypothetical protein PGT21_001845 [Puccinia graminis f. sp. tritici]|uniref:Uncharacterized protein n=1 Tax=Puccinia graminis f. sp. tritici TaxID=56615 RepID=A0A5B0Q4W7_PUCGR|nr:hypothetical protein PGT21_001845 [Puccinia graminis f. sp. tritici]
MDMEWSKEHVIQLREAFLTQIDIQSDWNWNNAKQDLRILTEILGFKIEPYEEPSPLILNSGLMNFEPNRSSLALSKLLNFNPVNRPQRAVNYDQSILKAAQFLLGHIPKFNSDLNQNTFKIESEHPVLFKLITEFAKVYQARLIIYELCSTDWVFSKLLAWDQSLKQKNIDFFDDEPDRFSKAKDLIDRELGRGENDEPRDT